LITGKSGCGKSTLLSSLTKSRHRIFNDGYGLVYKVNSAVRVTSPFKIINTFGLLKLKNPTLYNPQLLNNYNLKERPQEEYSNNGFNLGKIIFPQITCEYKCRMFEISKRDAVKRLISFSSSSINNSDKAVKDRQINLLTDLAKQCRSYVFLSGREVVENPSFLGYDFLKDNCS